LAGARVWLSFVTVGELWKWAEVRSWGQGNRARLETWIANRPVVPYDDEIARTWGTTGRRCSTPRATASAERHVDRCLRDPPRPSAAHLEPQGLRRLRGTRRTRLAGRRGV